MTRTPASELGGANVAAFLDTLAFSEGTPRYGREDGYNVIVGGDIFHGYHDHPRVLVHLPKLGIKSTAAGRYQLLARYFDAYRQQLALPDFSPRSQDLIALRQIREQGAYEDVVEGRIVTAVRRCRNIWASLPGAGYGQHEHRIDSLISAYLRFGGTLA